jgi:hypothetical protein
MSGHQRTWDETQSPQWKYILNNEHQERKQQRRVEDEQIRVKRVSKRQKIRKETNKAGKKIVYSASPTGRTFSTNDKLRSELKNVGKDKEVVLGESA